MFRVKVVGQVFEKYCGNKPLVGETKRASLQINATTGIQSTKHGSSDGDEINLTLSEYFKIKDSHKRVREVGESSKCKSDLPPTQAS